MFVLQTNYQHSPSLENIRGFGRHILRHTAFRTKQAIRQKHLPWAFRLVRACPQQTEDCQIRRGLQDELDSPPLPHCCPPCLAPQTAESLLLYPPSIPTKDQPQFYSNKAWTVAAIFASLMSMIPRCTLYIQARTLIQDCNSWSLSTCPAPILGSTLPSTRLSHAHLARLQESRGSPSSCSNQVMARTCRPRRKRLKLGYEDRDSEFGTQGLVIENEELDFRREQEGSKLEESHDPRGPSKFGEPPQLKWRRIGANVDIT